MTIGALVIRHLEERPEAAALLAEGFVAEWPEYHRGKSLPDIASRFRLVSDAHLTLIAEIENDVVGTVALRRHWEAVPEIESPWIGALYVVPQHRGRGVGMSLVDAAVAEAAEQGHPVVHIAVRVDPTSYFHKGWRVVGSVLAGDEKVTVLRIQTGA